MVWSIHVGHDIEHLGRSRSRLDSFELERSRTSIRLDHVRNLRARVVEPAEATAKDRPVTAYVHGFFRTGDKGDAAVNRHGCVGKAERHPVDRA